MTDDYWLHDSYIISNMIGLFIILTITLLVNVPVLVIAYHKGNMKDEQFFLFAIIAFSDLTCCVFESLITTIPHQLVILTKSIIDNKQFFEFTHVIGGFVAALYAISGLSFATYCVLKTLLLVSEAIRNNEKLVNGLCAIFILLYGTAVGLPFYKHAYSSWHYILTASTNLFIPCLASVIALSVYWYITKYKSSPNIPASRSFSFKILITILIVITAFIAPYYITLLTDDYCCELDWEISTRLTHFGDALFILKNCTIPIILLTCDRRYRDKATRLTWLSCLANPIFIREPEQVFTIQTYGEERDSDDEPLI